MQSNTQMEDRGGMAQLAADEVTNDLRLPVGSACIQIVLHAAEGSLDVRTVLIGALEIDPKNPAHRIADALNALLPGVMVSVLGKEVRPMDHAEFRERLADEPLKKHMDTLPGVADVETAPEFRKRLTRNEKAAVTSALLDAEIAAIDNAIKTYRVGNQEGATYVKARSPHEAGEKLFLVYGPLPTSMTFTEVDPAQVPADADVL